METYPLNPRPLFAIDIDGTLIGESYRISGRMLDAVRGISKHAHVSLVSARPLRSVLELAAQIGLTEPMAALNGAVIGDISGKIFNRRSIEQENLLKILKCFKTADTVTLNLYSGNSWIASKADILVQQESDILGFPPNATIPVCDLEEWILNNPVEKVLVLHPEQEAKAIGEFAAEIGQNLTGAFSKSGYFEITVKNCDKGFALEYLADFYKVDMAATIAIGDGHVDIPMFKVAGHPVAMENASEDVKSWAKHIIGNVEKDGLATYLENYPLLG